jgi:hypothetical protein
MMLKIKPGRILFSCAAFPDFGDVLLTTDKKGGVDCQDKRRVAEWILD